MADTDPDNTPDQPEDAAPAEATGGDEGGGADDLAAAALKAAQEAVSGLNDGGDENVAEDPQAAASAAADEAMAAMLSGAGGGGGDGASPVEMPSFAPGQLAPEPGGIDLLSDVNLDVTIELGRTRMYVEDVLKLAEGAVVELDKLAGDPVDIYVNQRHVARGEVLILNDNFCVRVNEIVEAHPETAAG